MIVMSLFGSSFNNGEANIWSSSQKMKEEKRQIMLLHFSYTLQ